MTASAAGHRHTGSPTFYPLIAVAILFALAAFLTFDDGLIADPKPSKRRSTTSAFEVIRTGLESYVIYFGEYPEPLNPEEIAEILPGQTCRIGAAKCLYQALSGDGEDAIKGIKPNGKRLSSDGTISDDETKNVVVHDIPADMVRKVGDSYILVDAFGRPFQYVTGEVGKRNIIRDSYDLWSYGEDDRNILATSKDTESNPQRAAKWIKNW